MKEVKRNAELYYLAHPKELLELVEIDEIKLYGLIRMSICCGDCNMGNFKKRCKDTTTKQIAETLSKDEIIRIKEEK